MSPSTPSPIQLRQPRRLGFTLVEVLVSMVILAMIMLIITQVIGQAQRSWKGASSRVSQFREARTAFDTITRNLRQATVNPYRTFLYPNGSTYPSTALEAPTGLARRAELGFRTDLASAMVRNGGNSQYLPGHAVTFQAPLGKSITMEGGVPAYAHLQSLLCIRSYFVRFASNESDIPVGLRGRLQAKNRYRLFEYRPPAEVNAAYNEAYTTGLTGEWTVVDLSSGSNYVRPVAENIILLLFAPSFSSGETATSPGGGNTIGLSSSNTPDLFTYNSFTGSQSGTAGLITPFRLPRSVQVVMVAVDEESAQRLELQNGTSPPNLVGRSGASFSAPESLSSDLEKLRNTLGEQRINYRVFNSIVYVPGSDV